jgi:hypothetical protein
MIEAITLGLWSYHFDQSWSPKQTHDLVGFQYERAYVAKYNNSYDKTSVIAAYATKPDCWGKFCVDWLAGVVTGYEQRTGMTATPFVLPRLKLEIVDNINVYAIVIPTEVVAAGFEVRF